MEKALTPQEALKALADGKKLIHPAGIDHIYMDDKGIVLISDGSEYASGNYIGFFIYQEPKKKVKIYKWALKTSAGRWSESDCFYKDESEFKMNAWEAKERPVMRLDHTMIEVEE